MNKKYNLPVNVWFVIMASIFFTCSQSCGQSRPVFVYKRVPKELLARQKSIPSESMKNEDATDLTFSLPNGYVKDGSQDYTRVIQDALKPGGIYKFPEFPILINDKGLKIGSNTSVYFPKGAKLIMKPSAKGNYQMLIVHNVENVTINDAVLVGDRLKHIGDKGEWGMGISIRGSKNVVVNNPIVSNFWGDGIYIASISNTLSRDIVINNAALDNNRRNGISIISVVGLKIINPLISNTNGTKPMAGICFEPNNNEDFLDAIYISNPTTFNNAEWGIIFTLNHMIGDVSRSINIDVKDHLDVNSNVGLCYRNFKKAYPGGKPLSGRINIINPSWKENASPFLGGRSYGFSPLVVIKNPKAYKKGSNQIDAEYMDRSKKYLSVDKLIKFEN